MKAADRKRIEAQQQAQITFIERMDTMRQFYQRELNMPAPDYPKNTLGYMSYTDKRQEAEKRVESLTHAIHELRDLSV